MRAASSLDLVHRGRYLGLRGWERDTVHVLAPAGTRRPAVQGLVLHRTADWQRADIAAGRRMHRLAGSLVIAAGSFPSSRPGCGMLAAAVQQRLLKPAELHAAVRDASRIRHRASLLAAVGDIAQGAQALSEIDFIRLPMPTSRAVRIEPNGRRRYLDAEWRLRGGRVVAVEVDGALRLTPRRWQDDQLRQNEIVIGGTILLRYPSIVVRDEPALVVSKLCRVLGPRRS